LKALVFDVFPSPTAPKSVKSALWFNFDNLLPGTARKL
jgi:hypothetical protein